MEKICLINEQQVTEIDELCDKIWKFGEPITNLEVLLTGNNVEEEIWLIRKQC